ncbi:MAG: ABC transporter substrate-binding protein [Peptococcaceae bacterium]|jgi:NitT/TauT family transport system substrate-binding protein|nr:ABC transporter substrate-binding protein [Peptococcaceae bacterium]
MKHLVKKISVIILCVLILVTLVGCSGTGGAGSTSLDEESQTKIIQVGTWKTAQTIQPFYYDQYIEGNNQVKVLPFTNPGDQKTALLAGDLTMCGTTLVTAITAASKGEPVVMVSNLCNKCSALVVRKDTGINSVADLKGKTIAYVPGTMHHVLLLEVLQGAGLDPARDVTLTRIDFFDMGQALAQGSIDAFCSGEPYPSIALAEGYGQILSYPYFDDSIGTINAGMLTTREQIDNNRILIQKLVNAHVEATEYLNSNKDQWLNKANEFGTDLQVLEYAVDNMELAWDMDDQFIAQTKKLAERMKELGVISEVPDIDKLIDVSFVQQARKELGK